MASAQPLSLEFSDRRLVADTLDCMDGPVP
jgi:hypothetical protein